LQNMLIPAKVEISTREILAERSEMLLLSCK
jgi:hypothetical protein